MTKVLLVRHGATDWNLEKRAQGQADIPLNDIGVMQAKEVAERLAQLEIAAVYSSDLSRSADTARTIADAHGLEVVTDPAFREVDQGEWTGLTNDEIKARWPDRWGYRRHFSTRPGGESPEQVRRRALEGVARIVEKHPDRTVVLVSHGGTIRWISAEALGFDDRRSADIRGVGNGAIVCIDAALDDGRLVLDNLARWDGKTTGTDDPND